jgi:hypothetical protein
LPFDNGGAPWVGRSSHYSRLIGPMAIFGSFPAHDRGSAERLMERLRLENYDFAQLTTFDQGMYPPKETLFIGSYADGMALCELDLPCHFFNEEAGRAIGGNRTHSGAFKADILGLYPAGQVLILILHSVVNLWGYSLYVSGKLVRSAAGASDNGLIVDLGTPLPEEAEILARCQIERIDEEGLGEEPVFEVAKRVFVKRIDTFDELPLQMSEYKRKPNRSRSLLRRLLGQG